MFRRNTVVIDSFSKQVSPKAAPKLKPVVMEAHSDASVLIINASHEMAKEITLQLTLELPGCSIMYAPTVELAGWILKRRKIDLVVSSPILPDGPITKLRKTVHELPSPPDMVVIGELNIRNAESLSSFGYEQTKIKKLSAVPKDVVKTLPIIHKRRTEDSVKTLGADIRNDLNNPLQEIVAMVFVAKASGQSDNADHALEAIERAAQNMAKVVSGIEDKIREVVL